MNETIEEFSRIYKLDNVSEILVHTGKELLVSKDQVIISPGEKLDGFYLVKEGRVIAKQYSPKGSVKIICILEENSIFFESNALFGIPACCFFKATENSILIFVKTEDLLDLLVKDLNVALFIMQSLTMKFYSNLNHADELLFYDTNWRVCHFFLTLAENFGVVEGNKIRINIKISQQFISNLVGINRVTSVRIIQKLKNLNLIEQTNGYYYIKDLEGLKKHMDTSLN